MIDQILATNLLTELKRFEDTSTIIMSDKHRKHTRKLIGTSSDFILDIRNGNIELSKVKYQARHSYTNTILLRIDTSSGGRHINPDGTLIECPHIHIYQEGYGDKWAYPLDTSIFSDINDITAILKDFLNYFHVENIPRIFYSPKLL